jgi:hypothetical protein
MKLFKTTNQKIKEAEEYIKELKMLLSEEYAKVECLKKKHNDTEEAKNHVIERLEAKISALEEDRADMLKVEKQSLKNADTAAILEVKKKGLDRREKSLDERENKLADAEETKKMAAYADGLADGLRKAYEITEKDRENALKVAMVSAASHTSPEIMKELNSVHQITAGDSQK